MDWLGALKHVCKTAVAMQHVTRFDLSLIAWWLVACQCRPRRRLITLAIVKSKLEFDMVGPFWRLFKMKFTWSSLVHSGATTCRKGFVKYFPRLPQAVGLYCRCMLPKQGRGTYRKPITKHFLQVAAPDCNLTRPMTSVKCIIHLFWSSSPALLRRFHGYLHTMRLFSVFGTIERHKGL